jgi:hypothetical protein
MIDEIRKTIIFYVDTSSRKKFVVDYSFADLSEKYPLEVIEKEFGDMLADETLTESIDGLIVVTEWMPRTSLKFKKERENVRK